MKAAGAWSCIAGFAVAVGAAGACGGGAKGPEELTAIDVARAMAKSGVGGHGEEVHSDHWATTGTRDTIIEVFLYRSAESRKLDAQIERAWLDEHLGGDFYEAVQCGPLLVSISQSHEPNLARPADLVRWRGEVESVLPKLYGRDCKDVRLR